MSKRKNFQKNEPKQPSDPPQELQDLLYLPKAHQFELELQNREAYNFISAVLDTAGALIVVLDRQGRIVRFNRACEQLSGYSFEQVQGQPIWDLLLLPKERAPVKAVFQQLSAGQFPNEFENHWVAQDGSRYLISWSNTALSDSSGKVQYVIGIGIDITQLREAKETYQTLVKHSLQGLAILRGFEVVFANTVLARITGYTVDELKSFSADEAVALVHADDRAAVWQRARDRLAANPTESRYEFRLIRKDGAVCWLEVFASRIEYLGKPATQVAVIDITQRKQVEEAYRALVDYSLQGLAIFAQAGQGIRLVFANPGLSRIGGYSTPELMAMGPDQLKTLVHPEDQAWVWQHARDYLTGESVSPRFEFRFICKIRLVRWVEGYANRIEYRGKSALQVAFMDITERKRAEETLRENEARLEGIISTATDAIITIEADQRIILFNAAAEQMFGYKAEEVIGQPLNLLLPERFRARHTRYIDYFGQTGVTARSMGQPGELYGRRADGREFPIEVMISQVEVARRKLYTAIARDITARKQAEEAQAYLAAIVDSSDDAIIGKTLEGTVVSWNRGAERLYGYRAEEMIGRSITRIFPLERYYELPYLLTRLRWGESIKNYETQRITKDGRRLIVALTLSPIKNAAGNLMGASVIAQDITTRKQTELELAQLLETVSEQREQLRALTRQLAETQEAERKALARELHDQVGQKLTALNLNLNTLRARLAETLTSPEPLMAMLEQSLTLVEETAERVQNVMIDLRPPMLDDYGLLAALQWYGTEVAARMNFSVAVRGQEPAPRLAAPIEYALFRITQEALTNVAKHAQAGQVTITLEQNKNKVWLIIADDGQGFDFSQSVKAGERSGWGLLTMTERAETVGGHCQIKSHPGQGTQVMVEVER